MGVYLRDMEKPKNCFQCSFNDGIYCCLIDTDTDALIPKMPTERLPHCPLIEIDLVRCGECKWFINEGSVTICDMHEQYIEPTDFCSYGERRADDR